MQLILDIILNYYNIMNLIIYCRFNKELSLYNTTGDYNIANDLFELTKNK